MVNIDSLCNFGLSVALCVVATRVQVLGVEIPARTNKEQFSEGFQCLNKKGVTILYHTQIPDDKVNTVHQAAR